ncbi:MAG: hypothetical protein Q7S82_00935, partial [bacterium]|nr:hypothetical protein [bacterium]
MKIIIVICLGAMRTASSSSPSRATAKGEEESLLSSPFATLGDGVFAARKSGRASPSEAGWEGVIPSLERRYHETDSDYTRSEIEQYMVEKKC